MPTPHPNPLSVTMSAFGCELKNRSFSGNKYRYGFNGMEKDDEVKGENNSYDFGARIYDNRLGRFLSLDAFNSKNPFFTPYHFAANRPLHSVEIYGDSLYILFYTSEHKTSAEDEMFYASALTRKTDIERSENFDSKRDKIVLIAVQDISDIKEKTEAAVKKYSKKYGATVEVDFWSHSGTDGPIGSESTSSHSLEGTQMDLEGWETINFNWANEGEGCRAGFYGCNSGVDPEGDKASFATEVSGLSNFENVKVFGQTASSFPSSYTDYRSNSENGAGNFVEGTNDGIVTFYRTYMVGGYRRSEDWNLNEQNVALPVRVSKNGEGTIGGYQSGDVKTSAMFDAALKVVSDVKKP